MDIFNSPPEIYSSAPGRVNLIGEHTDYNLGYVLPAAIHLHVSFLASRRTDGIVRVWADCFKQEKSFSIHKDLGEKQGGWIDYIKGVFWVLLRKGATIRGINAYIWGNIPLESGLSSSAAYEVSIVNALDSLFELRLSPLETAQLAQAAENDYVGVKCGLMDQFISVYGKKDHALFLDCETLAYDYIPLRLRQEDLSIFVYDTKVSRDLASSPYNKRREEAASALERLRNHGIQTYKNVTLPLLDDKRTELGETLYKRARHIIAENKRVHEAVEALRKDDFHELGRLLFLSHESLRDDYQVSCPELDLLYECGRRSFSCLGARLTGAGFGGSGIALIQKRGFPSFKRLILNEARRRGFVTPAFYEVEVGEGARVRSVEVD
jgi:galactokinase